jgi:hypothetical protein
MTPHDTNQRNTSRSDRLKELADFQVFVDLMYKTVVNVKMMNKLMKKMDKIVVMLHVWAT